MSFKVKPSSTATVASLQRLRAAFNDLRPAFQNAAKELTRRIWYRFAFKRDPDGKRWAPWARSTADAAKRQPGRKLMLDSRATRDSTKFVPGKRDMRVELGTSYANYHEQPSKGGGVLPRRAFVFSQRNGGRALALSDEQYLLNAINYQIRKAKGGR